MKLKFMNMSKNNKLHILLKTCLYLNKIHMFIENEGLIMI